MLSRERSCRSPREVRRSLHISQSACKEVSAETTCGATERLQFSFWNEEKSVPRTRSAMLTPCGTQEESLFCMCVCFKSSPHNPALVRGLKCDSPPPRTSTLVAPTPAGRRGDISHKVLGKGLAPGLNTQMKEAGRRGRSQEPPVLLLDLQT